MVMKSRRYEALSARLDDLEATVRTLAARLTGGGPSSAEALSETRRAQPTRLSPMSLPMAIDHVLTRARRIGEGWLTPAEIQERLSSSSLLPGRAAPLAIKPVQVALASNRDRMPWAWRRHPDNGRCVQYRSTRPH